MGSGCSSKASAPSSDAGYGNQPLSPTLESGFSGSDSSAKSAGNPRTSTPAGSDKSSIASIDRSNARTGGRGCYGSSFLLSNINRLITASGRSKVRILYDQAVKSNALFVGVTETWLHPGVLDAEVSHAFPGYSLYRADRAGARQGGGVALLLREDLTGDVLATYVEKHPNRNGSVCELLVIKVYQLDTVICVLYRPPDTRIKEFTGVL